MMEYAKIFPRDILLSDELAAQDKQSREFKIHAKVEPIIRNISIFLVSCLALIYSILGYTDFDYVTILFFSLGSFVIHGGLTWLVLWNYLHRYPTVYDAVAILDFLFMTIGVYFTGGESSFLFFIYISRIADQITVKDKRRVLYFSILAPLFYAAMLLYIAIVDQRTIEPLIETLKIISLLGCSAYLMVVGRSVGYLKGKMISFLHAAKTAYRLLEEKRIETEKLYDHQNEFLGMAAHDLRNPLNAIEGLINLTLYDIRNNRFDPVESRQELENVVVLTQRMSYLVSDLLDISAIESGKVTLSMGSINLNDIFMECENLHIRTAAHKNITLTVEKNPAMPNVMGDSLRIINVMDNLMSNAIKYTYPGGTIRVYCESENGEVITHVQDNGQGLSADDLKHIFTSFKKLSSRPTGGEHSTGLGLAIAKKVIELHHGNIWVESEKGKGSRFSFSLTVTEPSLN